MELKKGAIAPFFNRYSLRNFEELAVSINRVALIDS